MNISLLSYNPIKSSTLPPPQKKKQTTNYIQTTNAKERVNFPTPDLKLIASSPFARLHGSAWEAKVAFDGSDCTTMTSWSWAA